MNKKIGEKKIGEGKGGKYSEKEKIFFAEKKPGEEKRRRKRRKMFGKENRGKYHGEEKILADM